MIKTQGDTRKEKPLSFSRIVYESLASESLIEADVLDILRKSQVRNNQERVSGILFFKGGRFLQFIEGPHQAVDALLARITKDPRHRDIRILSETTGDELLMPTWAMAYTSSSPEQNSSDTFVLGQQQLQSICELLPELIAQPFLAQLADTSRSA